MLISIIIILAALLTISATMNAVQFFINLWYDRRHEKMFLKRTKWNTRYQMLLRKFRVERKAYDDLYIDYEKIERMPRLTNVDFKQGYIEVSEHFLGNSELSKITSNMVIVPQKRESVISDASFQSRLDEVEQIHSAQGGYCYGSRCGCIRR